jgi:hypothetical protein
MILKDLDSFPEVNRTIYQPAGYLERFISDNALEFVTLIV